MIDMTNINKAVAHVANKQRKQDTRNQFIYWAIVVPVMIAVIYFSGLWLSGSTVATHQEVRTIEGVEYTCNIFEQSPAPYGFEGYQAFCGNVENIFGQVEMNLFIKDDGTIQRI